MMITTCLSCLTTGGPDKRKQGAVTKSNQENSGGAKGGRTRQPIVCLVKKLTQKNLGGAKRRREEVLCPANLPESSSLESILVETCTRHQEGPGVRMIGQRQSGN